MTPRPSAPSSVNESSSSPDLQGLLAYSNELTAASNTYRAPDTVPSTLHGFPIHTAPHFTNKKPRERGVDFFAPGHSWYVTDPVLRSRLTLEATFSHALL